MSFGVFGVFNRISMKTSFGGDVFNLWVGFFGVPAGWSAVGDRARLSGVASGAGGAFLFAGAIECCFSSWNGGRRCWDLCFLDAQTGSMNNMKMVMKVGT